MKIDNNFWNDLPNTMFTEHGQAFSVIKLKNNYKFMQNTLRDIVNQGLDAKQCFQLAQRTLKKIEE